MPCRILTSSNWFSQALSAISSPKSCAVARVACLPRRSRRRSRTFSAVMASSRPGDGRQRVVRHGHLPEREVLTGIGPVALRQPRVRDRAAAADDHGRIRFSPMILPPYMRRSKSIGCARAFGICDRSAEGRLAGRSCDLGQARPLGQALCLHMGRWHSSAGAPGRGSAVHSRHHRRDAGRHEGTDRLHRRHS